VNIRIPFWCRGVLERSEPVPFRLTRNLQTFFTPFGVEGVFITAMAVAAQVSFSRCTNTTCTTLAMQDNRTSETEILLFFELSASKPYASEQTVFCDCAWLVACLLAAFILVSAHTTNNICHDGIMVHASSADLLCLVNALTV
jgi:hypothetical protein